MRELELQLPAGAHLIGIDEHTALILDLEADTARVSGLGGVTVRVDNTSEVLPSGTEVPLARLSPLAGRSLAVGSTAVDSTAVDSTAVRADLESGTSLRGSTDAAHAKFTAALAARSAEAAGPIVLDLEQALADDGSGWQHPKEAEHARRTLRGMVLELAAAADGLSDPRELLEPLVEALLEQRAAARGRRDFAAADVMRDQLAAAGIDVRDSPLGVEWSLREHAAATRTPASATR
jgi:hypothetical protein